MKKEAASLVLASLALLVACVYLIGKVLKGV